MKKIMILLMFALSLNIQADNSNLELKISVYINDIKIDSLVYKNNFTPPIAGHDYLSSFVNLKKIMGALNAKLIMTNDYIRVIGEKTGNIEFCLGKDKRIKKFDSVSFDGKFRDYGTAWEQVTLIDKDYYIAISEVRYLINGSLKQTDTSVTLFTQDFERLDIPLTLDECYSLLNNELNPKTKDAIKNTNEMEMYKFHFNIGLWIRNNWVYPGKNRIGKIFTEKGIKHPDYISNIILKGYHFYLNGVTKSIEDLMDKYPREL